MMVMLIDACLCICSIFEGGVIPYPKRDFLVEDEADDKADAGAAKRPNCDNVSTLYYYVYQDLLFLHAVLIVVVSIVTYSWPV